MSTDIFDAVRAGDGEAVARLAAGGGARAADAEGVTALMLAAPTVAIDLPMKALAWQDQVGRVWLTYNAPALSPVRHGLAAELAARLDPVGTLLERAVE